MSEYERHSLSLKENLMRVRLLSDWQWLTILGLLVSAAVGCVVFAFSTFETKEDKLDFQGRTDLRLERMENKIDQLLLLKRK